MSEPRMLYRRLHGYMCILLLLQQFHVVILNDVHHIFSNLEHLSEKLKKQQGDLKSKANEYIQDCSEDHLGDIGDIGSASTMQGVITRLIMALLYLVAGCGPAAREIIHDLTQHVDRDTLNEMIDVIYDIADDMEKTDSQNAEANDEMDEEEDDMEELSSDDETAFLSEFLIENVLNSAEMMKLFGTLAAGDTFENSTDVENFASEIAEFSLEEIIDRPNYEWIAYPSANDTSTASIIKTNVESLVNRLNSNTTDRILRELTVPVDIDEKTRLLIIYEKTYHKILSVSEENTLILADYDETNIQQQLWVLDDGIVINIGSHLALHTVEISNVSSVVTLDNPDNSLRWRLFGGFLVYASNSDCVLDMNIGTFPHYSSFIQPVNVSLNCQGNYVDTDTSVIYFAESNTPEKFVQNVEKPLSFLKSILQKLSNTKFMVFVSLLDFIIKTSLPGYKKQNKIKSPESIRLESTFFIKNILKPCKVLSVKTVNETSVITFDDFSELTIDRQLWYWKENQLINVGTGTPLEINNGLNVYGELDVYDNKYYRLWTRENGKLLMLRNDSCQIVYSEYHAKLALDCSNSTSLFMWDFIEFNNPNFFVDVVCLYAIQTSVWPCEYLTAEKDSKPYVYPIRNNIFSQLWYLSNGNLINADSGLALTEINNTNALGLCSIDKPNLTIWYFQNEEKTISPYQNDMILTLESTKNGTVTLQSNKMLITQKWSVISLDSLVDGSVTCKDRITDTLTPFVIRNNKVPACQLLTVVEMNDNSSSLQMKHFDEDNLENHVWVNYEGSIINVASGLSLQPKVETGQNTYNEVFPGQLHAFQKGEKWYIDNNNKIYWDLNSDCFLDYISGSLVMNCNEKETVAAEWSFTTLPSDENDLIDTLTFMCFYFIKSKYEPCQYVTADPKTGNVHLRPLTQDLLPNQLWYWNERTINLAATGQYFGVHNLDDDNVQPWLALIEPVEINNLTSWIFVKDNLLLQNNVAHTSVDYKNDGKLYLSKENYDSPFHVTFVDYSTFTQDDTDCSIPLDETTTFFFIRSHTNDCLVLKGTNIGNPPLFESFDQDDIESQLWFYEQGHIINLKTYLVLHASVDSHIAGSQIVMQPFFKYAIEQTWTIAGDMIFYAESEFCVLDVDVDKETLIVWCKIHGGINQLWDIIKFDDNAEYLQKLTCLFFFRHNIIPCDLLTHITGSTVLIRPVTEQFIRSQIWYWSGNHIISASTGMAIDFSTQSRSVYLNSKSMYQQTQKWIKDGSYVVSKTDNNLVIGLDKNNGKSKVFDKRYSVNSDVSRWTIIDYESGIEDSSQLSCEENLNDPTVFFIRSEKDPCHVLSENSNGQITLLKAGTDNSNQAWVKIRRHIANAISGKVLSVHNIAPGEPVIGEHRYEHEIKQHWWNHGSSVRISGDGNTFLLDAYNDVCVWQQDGSDGQKWVWLNVKDVKDDNNLLRCSKCYNKHEEKANEVISYIPIFGWLYALVRAPVYAAKGCDEVAKQTLIDFGIGFALDLGMAIVTVLTAGTASAAALGVKTAVQSGFKLGLKAAMKAITSSIKLALKQAINAGKVLLKQGIKKSVVSLAKKGLTSVKGIVKSNVKVIKNLPKTTKTFALNSGKSVKKMSIKLYNTVRSTTYGSFKSSVSNGLRKLPSALKKKLKKIGNGLADRAQRKINKLDDLKKGSGTNHVRCKRAGNVCNIPKKTGNGSPDVNIAKQSAFVPKPNAEVSKGFNDMLRVARKNTDIDGLQNAHFGLSRKTLHSKEAMKMDKDTIHSKVLSDVNEYPYDKNFNRINKDLKGNKIPQSHTEQALLDDIDKTIKKKCGGQNCELYLWTKNSPCMKNAYKFQGGSVGDAKSCFSMLIELCHKHVKTTPGFKKCHIGFRDFFGLDKTGADMQKEFMQELGSLTETMKNLATTPNRYPLLTKESLNDIGSFIKFYQIS